ncbi:MAG: hypothetical protein AB7N91_21030 [Candidatus Tectimicrobiota bacterium]
MNLTCTVPLDSVSRQSANAKKQAACVAGVSGRIVQPFRPQQPLAVVKKVLG